MVKLSINVNTQFPTDFHLLTILLTIIYFIIKIIDII
jgi:hypothetical protein